MIVACRATGLYRQIVLMVIVYLGLFETEPCGAAKIRGVVVLFRGAALRAPILADLIVITLFPYTTLFDLKSVV